VRRALDLLRAHAAAAFSLGYLLALLPFLGRNRLLGLDESIYANVALSAARDGAWAPFLFEGKPFFEKPPLGLGLQALSLLVFGASEWAARLPSALAAAGVVYLTWRLAERLGRSAAAGLFAAGAMAASEHFVLFSRVANLDMMLTLCLLGSWWELLKAYDPQDPESPKMRQREASKWAKGSMSGSRMPSPFHLPSSTSQKGLLLRAGLWLAAGLLVKSFFALLFVLPALIAFLRCRVKPPAVRDLLLFLAGPPLLAAALWFPAYGLVYGRPFFEWELGSNVVFRVVTGAVGRLFREADVDFQSWQLYAELAKNGLAFLWPLVLPGLAAWGREAHSGSARRQADPLLLSGFFVFLGWTFLVIAVMRPLINYLLPLVPLSALALAALWRRPPALRYSLLLLTGGLLAFANGLHRHAHPWPVFLASLVLAFLVMNRPDTKPHHWGRRGRVAVAVLVLGGSAWKLGTYLPTPPDPNAGWVEAVRANPARTKGEVLLFYGDPVDGRVLRFYGDYDVRWTNVAPPQRPREAMLFLYEGKVRFLPPLE
jgi:4-amino-4-deoxy-L-arabinose transferase-like glycosyltransferase